MIQSLYVDNYKSLVNTKISFDRINILLGKSGAGKSTIFEVLGILRAFLMGEKRVTECFPAGALTKWQDVSVQTFELASEDGGRTYAYRLEIEHMQGRERWSRVKREVVLCDGHPIFRAEEGHAYLYNDMMKEGPEILTDWTISGVSLVHARNDNRLLQQFKKEIENIIVCAPNPLMMQERTEKEDRQPSLDFCNFSSFFKWLIQEKTECWMPFQEAIREIIPAFRGMNLSGDESSKRLQVKFSVGEQEMTCGFDALSAGEKMLMALYLLTEYCATDGRYLFIDEPDNYVPLAEIRPWVERVNDLCGARMQCVLVSHNRVVIDSLASGGGIWLERADYGATRVVDPPESVAPLTVSEYIMRDV